MTSAAPLFQPFQLGSLALANRIVMAPMTRSFSPGGVPGEDVAAYYRRRAENAVGLIITEGTTIDRPGASFDPAVPNFHAPESLAGWKKVVDAVHAAGGKIAPQLWHVGLARRPGTGPHPDAPSDSPSGVLHTGKQIGEPMSEADIADTIHAFAKAARASVEIGFDAIELHGAHGYLIDQFFWDGLNKRSDRFGGDLVGRTSFGREIVKAVRAEMPADMPLILRYSQWKQQDYTARLAETPQALEAFLTPLAEAGVDIFHASTRRFWIPEFEGSDLNLAGWTKKLTGKPVITVGSVGLNSDFLGAFMGEGSPAASIDGLIKRFEAGEFDLVAVGRALLSDPEWAAKVRDGRFGDLNDFSAEALKELV
ncbi:MAG: NADH:flavin oxidoreductase [Oceanicaulis sp.]|uniref:NADH:flavin oxidoreductase n=1 Tax=Glycocaulis sp. TaxID=1969725 RepID=UPI0025C33CB5|nr:NADH:flavin oxidoreductase [Glycocaulis sp.]MCC5981686.1 NADH:flavin oxidoreductase [Oceanicaulis sp.]MCH8520520.1 NADH:flavin oxidoreductase [Glycocaulis sp.]